MFLPGIGFSRFTIQVEPSLGATYKTITINKTYVPSTQTNFVIKLDASLLGTDFFTKLASGGSPRFTLSDGSTLLPYEKIFLDTGANKGYYNVLVPTVNGTAEGSSTAIRVYYENSLLDLPVSDTYGRNAVWSNNYKCVQHLNTTPDLVQVNSTGNSSYDMTGHGSLTSSDVITAYYGGGNTHFYDSTGQYVHTAYCDITGFPITIGCAYRTPTSALDAGTICGFSDSTSSSYFFGLHLAGLKDPKSLYGADGTGGYLFGAPLFSNIGRTPWNFAVATYTSSTSRTLYLNASTPNTNTTSISFGGNYNSTSIAYMDFSADTYFSNFGDLAVQDFFIMNTAISANTYTTMYNNYTNASFFTVT